MAVAKRTGANGDAKRKRVRRGTRRTAAASSDDSSSDSSDSSSSSSESEAAEQSIAKPSKKQNDSKPLNDAQRRRQQALAAIESDSSSSSDSESSDDEDGGKDAAAAEEGAGARRRRNRKRTRTGKSNANEDVKKSSTVENSKAGSAIAMEDAVSAARQLEEPQSDSGMNDKMAAALGYVRQYFLDRPAWKFNKAKQEYLIRHMAQPEASATARSESGVNGDAEAGDEQDEATALPSGWPEPWTVCVAGYLNTIQGGAKARLVGKLQEMAQQPEPVAPPAPHEESEATTTATAAEPMQSAPREKSVSFGDVAMSAEQDAQKKPVELTPEERSQAQRTYATAVFRRDRSRKLLELLGEPIWA